MRQQSGVPTTQVSWLHGCTVASRKLNFSLMARGSKQRCSCGQSGSVLNVPDLAWPWNLYGIIPLGLNCSTVIHAPDSRLPFHQGALPSFPCLPQLYESRWEGRCCCGHFGKINSAHYPYFDAFQSKLLISLTLLHRKCMRLPRSFSTNCNCPSYIFIVGVRV